MGLAKCLILLGSNLGDKKKNIEYAVDVLSEECGKILKKSSFYDTEPWGTSSSNIYLNLAIVIETSINPFELLSITQKIETKIGRTRLNKWEDRIIDIDIILYENVIIDSENLKIPHPEFQKRKFCLIPANEIMPEWVHPLYHKKIKELLLLCKDSSMVTKV